MGGRNSSEVGPPGLWSRLVPVGFLPLGLASTPTLARKREEATKAKRRDLGNIVKKLDPRLRLVEDVKGWWEKESGRGGEEGGIYMLF